MLLGDAPKAIKVLNWEPKISFDEMILEMTLNDLDISGRDAPLKSNGFDITERHEL